MTHSEIVAAAIAHINRDRSEKVATLRELAPEYFEIKEVDAERILDNLALDYFGFSEENIDVSSIKRVFDAAKVIFALHPSKDQTFDLYSAMSYGSPWVANCDSPDLWAINFARRQLENDECAISGPINLEFAVEAVKLIESMTSVGISADIIKANVRDITYGRLPLEHAVCGYFGWEKRDFSEEELETERENNAA